MNIDQLTGRYARLRHELETAYAASPWEVARINRLADDIVCIERQLSTSHHANNALTQLSLPSAFHATPR